jgi:phage terminase large subunit
MEMESAPFKQLNQRTNELVILDYNPSFSSHWIYDDIIPRKDCHFIKTTQLDNPFLPDGQRNEILAYEPTEENIKNGTADKYLWEVYGLGLRSNRTGLIFRDVTYIDKFPEEIERIGVGQDFGYVNDPSATVKAGVIGNNLYLELLIYEPTKNASILSPLLKAVVDDDQIIFADVDPVMISDLVRMRHRVFAAKKPKGSVKYGIGLINSYKIHIVKNRDFQREQENYTWRVVNGITLDEPVDKFNHAWDAARYAVMMNFRKNSID